jgi:LPS-assembly protein
MPKTTSHTRNRLSQAMRLCRPRTATFILSSLIIPLPVLAETNDTHSQWECRAGADGGWVCSERTMPGRAYPRPERAAPVFDETEEELPEDGGPQVKLARNLDWVEEEALTPEEKEKMASGCCGAYIEPPRNYPDADLEPEEASLRVASSSTEVLQENIAHLKGDVHLTQGYRQVRSDYATVNQDERTVDLEGNVQLREPGMLLTGDTAHVNMDSKDIQINNSDYLFHESGVRGTADRLTRPSGDIFYIDNATYTTCEPGSNAWQLVSSEVDVNPGTGIAHAKHVRLEVKDIPVMYLPWIRFPIDDRRASGLLFPSFDVSEDNGIDFAQPIYLNLAPNYDATITPRYVQERGPMAEVEFRHMSEYTYTVLGGAFLSDDDGGDDSDEDPDAITGDREHEGEDRWLANIDHTGRFGRGWSTRIDYTRVSDDDYFRDLDNTTLEVSSRTHLRQLGFVSYNTDNWLFRLTGREYQTIAENTRDQYKLLPRIEANGDYRLGDFEFELNNQFSSFDHNDDNDLTTGSTFFIDDKNTYVTGDRLRLNYGATWDKQWAWGYFRPTAKIKHITYDLDDPLLGQSDDSPSVTVPVGIIDTGIYFERDTTWLNGYTQTFEPRLYMVYSKYEDQSDLPDFDTSELTFSYSQLFRDDRFVGGDRIGDTEQISVGLTTRLIDNSTGIERLRASLGQIYYLDDRYVSLNTMLTKSVLKSLNNPDDLTNLDEREIADGLLRDESAYAAEFSLRLWENLRLQADMLYDEENSEIDRGSASIRYHGQNNRIFNLGYRFINKVPRFYQPTSEYIDIDVEQADFSTIFPIFRNWSLIGRYNYDLTNSRNLETFVGLQYDSCCWRLSLLGRKWIDRNDNILLPEEDLTEDKGIFLQIQFKGLAGYGTKVESILKDGIYGYEPPAN